MSDFTAFLTGHEDPVLRWMGAVTILSASIYMAFPSCPHGRDVPR